MLNFEIRYTKALVILVFYRREISVWLKLNVCLSRNYYA